MIREPITSSGTGRIPRQMRYKAIAVLGLSLTVLSGLAQVREYAIDISAIQKITPQNLPLLGSTNAKNGDVTVNNYYITRSGIPIIPITGEFHFSRYPNQYWDESIKKMKAGGINMIATYVFWNIHEEKEGKFRWDGDRDLRRFVELCAKNDMMIVVRIGPFDHGEIRNGGLPDWLLAKPLTVRTNDPLYLHEVDILYDQIGRQLKGLYDKDGGPIIAVQLENEYQHSAAPWGLTYPGQPYDMTVADRDRNTAQEGVGVADAHNPYAQMGNDHMKALKTLALKAGIDVPIFTATGWGNAAIIPNETLPVTAAYAYPTWTAKRELSPFYLFKDMHQNPDYAPVRYKPMDYPAFAAELGAGIMSTYSRRPIVPPESVDALINRCLGSGANGIGYYMYHGGSTPVADHYFFNDETYGYPKISYDFQAPIGEYGQIRPSYKRLKLLHFFVNGFAAELARQVTVLPDNAQSITPGNTNDLRYALRTDGTSGFVFINNFQDNTVNHDKNNIRLKITLKNSTIDIPAKGGFNLKADENLVLPFNFDINQSRLVYATAQLLTKQSDGANHYCVFFTPAGIKGEFSFLKTGTSIQPVANTVVSRTGDRIRVNCLSEEPAGFIITSAKGVKTRVLVISKGLAENANEVNINGAVHLLFTDALVLPDNQSAELLSLGKNEYDLKIFPQTTRKPALKTGMIIPKGGDQLFSNYTVKLAKVVLNAEVLKTGARKASVKLPAGLPDGLNDIFMDVDYCGDTAMGFLDGDLVADEFYKGIPWEIGLKRFLGRHDNNFGLYFRPLMKNAPFMADLPVNVAEAAGKTNGLLKINGIKLIPEYKTTIKF